MRAQRAVAGNPDPTAVVFALIAELAQIDGAPIIYEDVIEMDLGDVLVLQAEVTEQIFPSRRRPPQRRRLRRTRPLRLRRRGPSGDGVDEIDFWMAAVADYNRASDEATSARRDNRQ